MSIINAITTPLSQLPLWRKKSTPVKQSERVSNGMVEEDREEDGFTFVGESESERNTVYPHNISNSWKTPPPPSYQQVSTPCSTLYHPHHDSTSASTLQCTYEPRSHTDRQHMQGSSMEELPHTAISIKDCIADVPFSLAPHILDPVFQDTSLAHCLPSTEISGFVYDFSLEKQVISYHINPSEIGRNDKSNNENPPIDECNDTEDQILQQYGQEAVVAQNMHDLLGGVSSTDTFGHQELYTQQDLMSFRNS